MSNLVIFRGLPGSGKSTRAKKEYPNYLHYEPDHLFCDTSGNYKFYIEIFDKAHEFIAHLVDFALARGENVVVSDVFVKKAEMDIYVDIARAHESDINIITCTETFGNSHNVPLFTLRKMAEDFED